MNPKPASLLSKLPRLFLILGLFILSYLLLLSQVSSDPKELIMTGWLRADGTFEVDSLKPTIGGWDPEYPIGDYSLVWLDNGIPQYNTSFTPIFQPADVPAPFEQIYILKRLPYKTNTGTLKLSQKGNPDRDVYVYNLRNLCNKNNQCDKFENYLSCPDDCPLNKNDGICILKKDGVCDPDCVRDPDCKKEDFKLAAASLLMILAVALVVYVKHSLIRKKKAK